MSFRIRKILYYSFFATQIAIIAIFFFQHKVQSVYSVAGINVIYLIYLYLERRFNIYVSNYIQGVVIITLITHTVIGQFFNFYQHFPLFDSFLHFLGTYSFTLLTYGIIDQILVISFTAKINQFIFLIFIGGTLGAVYEIIEFIMDLTFSPSIPNQPSIADTNMDLISDMIGSVIAACHVYFVDLNLRLNKHQ